jgi:hypothetical protein
MGWSKRAAIGNWFWELEAAAAAAFGQAWPEKGTPANGYDAIETESEDVNQNEMNEIFCSREQLARVANRYKSSLLEPNGQITRLDSNTGKRGRSSFSHKIHSVTILPLIVFKVHWLVKSHSWKNNGRGRKINPMCKVERQVKLQSCKLSVG